MREVDKYLRHWTGQDSKYWLDRIGWLIGQCAEPIKDHPGLFGCDPKEWLGTLTAELTKAVRRKLEPEYDENIAAAKVIGLVLVLWAARIGRAKCYDRRRELKGRRKSMGRTAAYAKLIAECLLDESSDHLYFPGQGWDPPYPPTARYEPDEAELRRQVYAKGQKKGKK